MPPPTNTSAGTATDITSLPYTLNQNVHDAGTTYTVWYKYTPDYTGVLGVWGHGDLSGVGYVPLSSFFDNGGVDIYAAIFNYPQRPIQIPVTSGHTVWFRFATNSGTVTPAQLAGTIQKFAAQTVPAGSILINDASSAEYLTALVSPTTGAPLDFKFPIVGGESMAQLTNGLMLLQDITDTRMKLYTGAFAEVATIAEYPTVISSNRTDLFYIGFGASKPQPGLVKTVDQIGVVGATTWDVGPGISSMAPSRDDAILYHAEGTTAAPIKRWDLVGNIAMSNLAAGVVDHTVREIFVLQDGTILVLYRDTSPTSSCYVVRYSTAGATLNTYTTQFTDSTGSDPHLAIANDDPTTFYAWFKIANGKSRFINIQTSTGTINTTAEGWHFSSGVLDASVAAGAPAYFGHSESCTFLITIVGIEPPVEPTTSIHYRRRVRTFPHLSEEQIYAFHKALQIDMETGVGLGDPDDPTAYNPKVMLDWSDDGGHTWSNVHEKTLGLIGHYKHRVFYRMLGRSRDRIYRLSMSDPVRAYVIAGYLDAEAGIS